MEMTDTEARYQERSNEPPNVETKNRLSHHSCCVGMSLKYQTSKNSKKSKNILDTLPVHDNIFSQIKNAWINYSH